MPSRNRRSMHGDHCRRAPNCRERSARRAASRACREPRSREPGPGPAAHCTHVLFRHRRAVSPAIAPPLFRAAAAGAGGRSMSAARDVHPPHRPVYGGQPNPRGARRAPSERMGFAKKFPPGHRDAAPAARGPLPVRSGRLRAGPRQRRIPGTSEIDIARRTRSDCRDRRCLANIWPRCHLTVITLRPVRPVRADRARMQQQPRSRALAAHRHRAARAAAAIRHRPRHQPLKRLVLLGERRLQAPVLVPQPDPRRPEQQPERRYPSENRQPLPHGICSPVEGAAPWSRVRAVPRCRMADRPTWPRTGGLPYAHISSGEC